MHAGHDVCYIASDTCHASNGTLEHQTRLIAGHRGRLDGPPMQSPHLVAAAALTGPIAVEARLTLPAISACLQAAGAISGALQGIRNRLVLTHQQKF